VDVPPPRPTQRLPPANTQEAQAARHVLPTAAPFKPGPAYKSCAPVEEPVDIEKLVETVLDANVTVPLRSLAGASTAVREEIRKQVTRLRKPIDKATYWAALPPESKVSNMVKIDHMPISAYLMVEEVTEEMPEGHFVADDPVLQITISTTSKGWRSWGAFSCTRQRTYSFYILSSKQSWTRRMLAR